MGGTPATMAVLGLSHVKLPSRLTGRSWAESCRIEASVLSGSSRPLAVSREPTPRRLAAHPKDYTR